MAYLYLDTSQKLCLGLYEKEDKWSSFEVSEIKKSSKEIHSLINKLLESKNLEITSLEGVVYCAGPGSYTGIRLSEGIAQILDWHEVKTYSFPMYSVPYVYGEKSGIWISQAYKGQYFCFKWNDSESTKVLVDKTDLEKELSDDRPRFSHLDEEIKNIANAKETVDLIKEHPKVLISHVVNKDLKIGPIYYRALEQEFVTVEERSKSK